jgi:hypothetical protein
MELVQNFKILFDCIQVSNLMGRILSAFYFFRNACSESINIVELVCFIRSSTFDTHLLELIYILVNLWNQEVRYFSIFNKSRHIIVFWSIEILYLSEVIAERNTRNIR